MKIRVLSLLLAVALVFSLSACSKEGSLGYLDKIISGGSDPDVETDPTDPAVEPDGEQPEDPTEDPGENPTEDPTEGSDEEALPSLGVYDGETYLYANEFLGLQCQLDEGWVVYDARQLAALYDSLTEIVTDEDILENIQNRSIATIFYAEKSSAWTTVTITLEDVGVRYGRLLSEEDCAEYALESVVNIAESIGGYNITAEIIPVNISGTEHPAVRLYYIFHNVGMYEMFFYIKQGQYFACISVSCASLDSTKYVLDKFSSL